MKQYLKPILLSGLVPDPDDPIQPPIGSVIGGDTRSRAVSLIPEENAQSVLETTVPVELPVAEPEAAAEAPVASPEVAPEVAVDLSPVAEAVPISIP